MRYWLLALVVTATAATGRADTLGNYTGHEIRPEGLTIRAGNAAVVITPYSDEMVRVSLRPHGEAGLDSSEVVIIQPCPFDWSVTPGDSEISVTGPRFSALISRSPLRVRWQFDGQAILQDESGFVWEGERRAARFQIAAAEHLYGGGERADGLDHRGRRLQGYNAPSYCYGDGAANLNIVIPFLLSSRHYGLYFENSYPHELDIGATDPNVLEYSVEGGELSYFLIGGGSAPDVLESYTELTGRQPLPPRWTLGFLQSRFGYQSEAEATATVDAFRAQQIPLDALILDLYWFGWGQMGDLDWDRTHWPNPASMMANFAETGVKTILITEPYIVQSSSSYPTCYEEGFLTPDSTGEPVILPNFWAGSAGLLEITLPAAQDWYWSLYRNRIEEGVTGWWSDLGEPEQHPDQMVHAAGSAREIHNVYSLTWAKLLFERYAAEYPTRRVFNLIRAGYAGMQRYSTFPWSGDVQRSFAGMRAQLPIMLNMGLSGAAMIGSDLGGFDCGQLDTELYIRWMQMGAWSPTMRAHGVNVPTEPVNFDSTTREIVAEAIRWRYRLLPYNYTLAWENHRTGMPLVRPLFFADESDVFDDLHGEYMWGGNFLVAPVTTGGTPPRAALLPAGQWIDFWTDYAYAGGQTAMLAAPLAHTPVLVRAGSLIPTVPVVQSTDDYDTDTLIVECFPDYTVATSEFTVYDDDGQTADAYQLGQYELVRLRGEWNGADYGIRFTRENHGFAGAPEQRRIYSRIHRVGTVPSRVVYGGQELPIVSDSLEFALADSAVWWDADEQILNVSIRWVGTDAEVVCEPLQILDAQSPRGTLPASVRLHAAYPNPFNAATTIEFEIAHAGRVELRVYDVTGREVATLLHERVAAGKHVARWEASGVASGIYIVRLQAAGMARATKLALVR